MTTTTERSVRLSQTLAPFGVGAIYDFMGESLVACETAWWKGHGTKLRLRRLEEQLEVSGFRSAPSHASRSAGARRRCRTTGFPNGSSVPAVDG